MPPTIEIPGTDVSAKKSTVRLPLTSAGTPGVVTLAANFDAIKHLLPSKPLRRPNRTRPISELTNEQLRRIAEKNPPPPEWFEEEEERPF